METFYTPSYTPPPLILDNYARVIVNNSGMQPGEVARLLIPISAYPMGYYLTSAVLDAGGVPDLELIPEGVRHLWDRASVAQNAALPIAGLLTRVEADRIFQLDGTQFPDLKVPNSDAQREAYNNARGRYRNAWGASGIPLMYAYWPTDHVAKSEGMTLAESWHDLIKVGYLDHANPIAKWAEINKRKQEVLDRLNALPISRFHIEAPGYADLYVTMSRASKFIHAGRQNFPTAELYTSPDWRGTEGWIKVNQPFSYDGDVMNDVYLRFENGIVVDFHASTNIETLKRYLSIPNANRLGEISMTDILFSPHRSRMRHDLFVENQPNNFHFALGHSHEETYKVSMDELAALQAGMNPHSICDVHQDLILIPNNKNELTVHAILDNGQKMRIFGGGHFVV